jgi:hypothetical protein
VFVQKLTEQQPRRTGADDDDLSAHGLFIASPAKIESSCILFARERPRFVTARRASFPFLCRVRF